MKTTLIHGHCCEALRKLEVKSLDVVITSPPYNIGKKYGTSYNDGASRDRFKAFCADWILQLKLLVKPDGSFFLNVGGTPANPLLPYELAGLCSQAFTLQNVFHWVKAISIDTKTSQQCVSVGHFKPINSPRFVTDCHEFVFHFTHGGNVPLDRLAIGVPYADKSNVKRWAHSGGRDKRCRGNVWFIPYETIQKKRTHPAPFPAKLVENCIRIHGVERAKTVCDPFMGSGTAGVVAARLGVEHFVGVEIEAGYFNAASEAIGAAQ